VDTPLGKAQVEFVDPTKPVACVPILRAGSVLLEQAATVLPAQVTYHFGALIAPQAPLQLP
jgi:uracil phosphoribosyltransferase